MKLANRGAIAVRTGAVLGVALLISAAQDVRAADECGAGATATCQNDGVPATDQNPYAGGITYNNNNQTLSLETGVAISSGANLGVNMTGSGTQTLNIATGVTISNTGSNDVVDIAGNASGTITISGAGSSVTATGLQAWGYGLVGQGAINATVGNVSVGGDGAIGIFAQSSGGPISITAEDITATGNTNGFGVSGISATGLGSGANGAVTVNTTAGTVSLTGATATSHAISAVSGNALGGGAVSVTTADVSTAAGGAHAINATTNGTGANGAVTVNTVAGEITTGGAAARGISATSSAGTNSGLVTVNAGNVTTTGSGASYAIFASSTSGAVTVTAGDLSTLGVGALGVSASGTGAVSVTTGEVDTAGNNAHAIQAASTGTVAVDSTAGAITTGGTNARGITVDKTGATATTIHAGTISTTGDEGQGIHVVSGTFGVGNGGAITITANAITTTGDSTSSVLGAGADGIEVITLGSGANGKVVIDTSVGAVPETLGSVSTTGDRSRGIKVESGRPDVSGPIGGGAIEITAGNVSTEGLSASAIDAVTQGSGADGAITITVLGTISTKGDGPAGTDAGPARGINAVSFGTGGNVSVTTKNVSTEGNDATGIFAQATGGTVAIDTTGGTVSTLGDGAIGIVGTYLDSGGPLTITTADVSTDGFGSIGVHGQAAGAANTLRIDTTAGAITTGGEISAGINAVSGRQPIGLTPGVDGGPMVVVSGDITTTGEGSVGINATGYRSSIDIDTRGGDILTSGLGSGGINVSNREGAVRVTTGNITIEGGADLGLLTAINVSTPVGVGEAGRITVDTSAGAIAMAAAANARALNLTSQSGPITATAGDVSVTASDGMGAFMSSFGTGADGAVGLTVNGAFAATGEFGIGALVLGGTTTAGAISATVAAGASVMGGWQADPDTPGENGAAAGLVMGGRAGTGLTALVDNAGSIGAWSDLAIATGDLGDFLVGLGYGYSGAGGGIEVQNTGTVTGYFRFGTGANLFHNNSANSLDLRDFADTNGNGVRDTERTAIADLGGPGATFDNDSVGWLRLLSVPGTNGIDGTVVVDDATAILQTGVHDIDIIGVEQGQILNTATFRNAGTISMMDAETGGSGAVAGDVLAITGGGTAGADGDGIFRSDGGALRIDTVLNEGGANAQSDLLVVDGTEVGSGGATRVFIANAGGTGLQTIDDGIKIVDVLDPTASAAGAFALGANVAAGGFIYGLFQGGVLDASDGDWYLRSSGMRNAVPLYASAPSAALLYGTTMLGTLNQRIGEPQPASSGGLTSDRFSGTVAWGRVIHDQGENRNGDFDEHGPDFDYAFSGVQTGIDLLRREHGDGSVDVAGIYFGAGAGNADADSLGEGSAGSLDFEAYSLGAYWTHFGPSGWYLDAVAQATYYADMTARSVDGDRLETAGWGVLASIEAGYPIALPAGWQIEPQAQLVYQSIDLDGAVDEVSQVEFGRAEGLRGRLGVRIVKDWSGGGRLPAVATWLRANVWHEFLGEPETTISDLDGLNPLAVSSDIGGTTGEVELGLSAEFTEHASAFATGHVAFALDGADRTGYGGRAGLRLEW